MICDKGFFNTIKEREWATFVESMESDRDNMLKFFYEIAEGSGLSKVTHTGLYTQKPKDFKGEPCDLPFVISQNMMEINKNEESFEGLIYDVYGLANFFGILNEDIIKFRKIYQKGNMSSVSYNGKFSVEKGYYAGLWQIENPSKDMDMEIKGNFVIKKEK